MKIKIAQHTRWGHLANEDGSARCLTTENIIVYGVANDRSANTAVYIGNLACDPEAVKLIELAVNTVIDRIIKTSDDPTLLNKLAGIKEIEFDKWQARWLEQDKEEYERLTRGIGIE